MHQQERNHQFHTMFWGRNRNIFFGGEGKVIFPIFPGAIQNQTKSDRQKRSSVLFPVQFSFSSFPFPFSSFSSTFFILNLFSLPLFFPISRKKFSMESQGALCSPCPAPACYPTDHIPLIGSRTPGPYALTTSRTLGQLSTGNWHYCAVLVKSVRFGKECKQSISILFLICHILWHFQNG